MGVAAQRTAANVADAAFPQLQSLFTTQESTIMKLFPNNNNNNDGTSLALNRKDVKKIMKWVLVGPLLKAGFKMAQLLKSCPLLHGIF